MECICCMDLPAEANGFCANCNDPELGCNTPNNLLASSEEVQ